MARSRNIGLGLKTVFISILVLQSFKASSQIVVEKGLPGDRYSISPYLQGDYLFLQETTLPAAVKFDFSLGIKYMRQPWRVYIENRPTEVDVPVDDRLQFRPAISFGYRQWFDLAAVVPLSYQTAGESGAIVSASGQEGVHLLDPELFIKIPILHRRRSGFGLAFASQLFVPVGSKEIFVGSKSWQGACVLIAWDFRDEQFSAVLNTGVHFKEHAYSLDTPIEPELLIRPGISYSVPLGSYSIGFAAEANIATNVYHPFNSNNVDAFQFLLSIQVRPAFLSGGLYAAAGGGAVAMGEGGGYSVPVAHFDGRIGYSVQWDGGEPLAAKTPTDWRSAGAPEKPAVAKAPEKPATASEESTAAKAPAEAPAEKPVVAQPVARVQPAPPERRAPVPVSVPMGEPISGRIMVARIHFPFDHPKPVAKGDPLSYLDTKEQPAISPEGRQQLLAAREKMAELLQAPYARLLVVGFTDKCYEGSPYFANVYNRELSHRRVNAMVDLLKQVLGGDLSGISIRTVALGWRCASSSCSCSNPDMPECAGDRRVEVYLEHSEAEGFRCPEEEYWLAR